MAGIVRRREGDSIGVAEWRVMNEMLAACQIGCLRTPVATDCERRVYCDAASVAGEIYCIGPYYYGWFVKEIDDAGKYQGRAFATGTGELYDAIAGLFAELARIQCQRTGNRLQREKRIEAMIQRWEDFDETF
jgi:hypothetical protein